MVHSSSRRRFSAALLAAIAGVLLAGDGAAAKERVLISTVRGFYNTAMDEIAAQYMELNPDVEIEINLQPDNYTITRYYTANMAADRATAPDIVHGNLLGVDQNFHMDRFLAVNDYLQRPNPYAGNVVWMDLFDPDLIRSMAVDGIHYCVIPLDFCDAAVYYNKDIFDRYGLKPPSTWDEWIEVCTVLEEHDILPIAVSGSTQTDFTGWIDLMFEDVCMRPFTPEIIARPGDWNYVEANDHYVHDLSNKDSDRYITINPERLISAVLDGIISYEMPHFVDAYSQFQTLTPHFAFGFLGTDQAGGLQPVPHRSGRHVADWQLASGLPDEGLARAARGDALRLGGVPLSRFTRGSRGHRAAAGCGWRRAPVLRGQQVRSGPTRPRHRLHDVPLHAGEGSLPDPADA